MRKLLTWKFGRKWFLVYWFPAEDSEWGFQRWGGEYILSLWRFEIVLNDLPF